MTTQTQKRPELRDVLLQIAAVDPLVALDVGCLTEFLLRTDGRSAAAEPPAAARGGSIAFVPVYGALMPRGGRSLYGSFTGMDGLRSQVASHAANPDVSAIVAHFDTPGGTVAGTPETAAAFKAAAAQKPVIAAVDLAGSAGYWLASQCSEIAIAPSGDVGSIGAMILHQDVSGMLEEWGIKMTMIRSEQSPLKNEAHPFAPLSEEATAFLQGRANEAGNDFIRAVAEGRRVTQTKVKEDFGKGRMYGSRDAISRGMADRVATLDDIIAGLAQQKPGARVRRRSALIFE